MNFDQYKHVNKNPKNFMQASLSKSIELINGKMIYMSLTQPKHSKQTHLYLSINFLTSFLITYKKIRFKNF